MCNNSTTLREFDLSSVKVLVTGAAPLREETADALLRIKPAWKVCQAYGITEAVGAVSWTSTTDIWKGSSGPLVPGLEARLLTPEGEEIEACDQPGEFLVRGPQLAVGYRNDQTRTASTFGSDGWMRTGDQAMIRLSAEGHYHVFVLDRIKDIIKVKVCLNDHLSMA